MVIDKLGNGVGLLYITDITESDYISAGITNNSAGVEIVKRHALTRSAVGFPIQAQGSFTFDSLVAPGKTILDVTVNGISQIESSINLTFGQSIQEAAFELSNAINDYIATSGVNYTAYVEDATVFLVDSTSSGSSVNGDVIAYSDAGAGTMTTTLVDIAGGSDGGELISSVNGAKYFLNPTVNAVIGNIASPGTEEISKFVINRGLQSQIPVLTQQIASSVVSSLDRTTQLQVLDLGAPGNTDLNSISGDFAINDILIVKNTSAFTITMKDLSLVPGNLKLSPTNFIMLNDDHIIHLMYVDDATDGLVWKEICRTPMTLGSDTVTDVELADLSVDTAAIQALAVTTAKIALNAITQAQMGTLSVGTPELIDLAVNQAKLALLSVGRPQMILNSVDATIIEDNAVTTAKILNANVTLEKLESSLKTELIVVPVSFEEAAVMGLIKVTIPYDCDVTSINVAVTKLIEATDDATIIPKDQSGTAMTAGQIDLTASAPLGNIFPSTPTGFNSFLAGEVLSLETSKSTVGGSALVSLRLTRV
tara:strand:+ start:440 stop:2053 length:1614 start_codon:yes stop_codon:yes gene_type:complete